MATEAIVTERQSSLIALNEKLALLIKRGEAIEVKDASGDLQAKQFKIECDSYYKAVDLYTGPDINDADERLKRLRAAKRLLLFPLDSVYERVEKSRKDWEEAERQAAGKESKKLSKKSGKKVEVKAAIPSVAGAPSRRNWKFNVKDVSKIKREFLMPNYVEIGNQVRKLKDKEKAEKLVGGIEVWSE